MERTCCSLIWCKARLQKRGSSPNRGLRGNRRPSRTTASKLQWTMSITPDATRLISGGSGKVNVWDVRKQRRVFSQPTAGTGYIQTVAISPDNKHVAAIPSSAGQDIQVFRIP